ncbi:Tyrosine--tRNA ligase 1, cytoplasmic [Dichanthelium oligosanthes]|uniref:tyrosine--tRNA ligase n=1 Tax=Dichanthelium oligosanthes TaxID=888268 RepID=A0A1E5VMW6_9POAL|nr:Tyrosine--tRNA ligase 1, cytoplasmic [Dichanthelium oligosanthes]
MDPSPAPEAVPGASSSNSSAAPAPAPAAAAVENLAGGVAAMTLDERFELLRGIGEECIQEDELLRLLQNKPQPICYDGFEPSGRMHIAQGIVKTINVNKMVRAGCKVKIWIADWFAQLNNKMGGDLKKIQTVGRYMIEIWKAAGMNLDGVEFLWSSEEINGRAAEYWPLVMDIARKNNVKRITRCCQIMGRSDQEELTAAQIFYPCMQCADIFFLKASIYNAIVLHAADICQLGMDQRKVNMLAREYCDDIKRKNKPIILSHHMLPGFKEGQEKMSKSDPNSAIFMEDDEAQVNVKIKQAFCPPKIVEGNPCLEYIKYIVFPWFGAFEVTRKESNGGNKTFVTMDELISDYESGALHPADVKPALAKAINIILQPVRDHFNNNSDAKLLLNTVKVHFLALLNEVQSDQLRSGSYSLCGEFRLSEFWNTDPFTESYQILECTISDTGIMWSQWPCLSLTAT